MNHIAPEVVLSARSGNRAALAAVVAHYEPLLRREARRHDGPRRQAQDYYQDAVVGLLIAVRKWSPRGKGANFTLYAHEWIRSALKGARRTNGGTGDPLVQERRNLWADNQAEQGELVMDRRTREQADEHTPETLLTQRDRTGRVRDAVYRAVRGGTPLEVAVVRDRMLSEKPHTLAALGKSHGVSHTRVDQVERGIRSRFANELREVA